jgi:hypothetical protein
MLNNYVELLYFVILPARVKRFHPLKIILLHIIPFRSKLSETVRNSTYIEVESRPVFSKEIFRAAKDSPLITVTISRNTQPSDQISEE